ncbi:YiiX/YebB-like N1pC/P60 family cysteine hydrolase [Myxococcota bacterium]
MNRVWLSWLSVLAVLFVGGPGQASSRSVRLRDISNAEMDARARSDARLLRSYAGGIDNILRQLDEHGDLWGRPKTIPLDPDERRLSFALFEQVLSYVIALDTMAAFHFDFWRIDVLTDPARHARHFALAFTGYCMKVRLGLAFIDKTLNKPQFEKLLDEGSRDHGLPPGAYARLKWSVVHVEVVSRVFSMHQYHKVLGKTAYPKLGMDPGRPTVLEMLEESYGAIKWRLLRRGVKLFAGNALDIIKDKGHEAWFPVQAQVAEVMGDTKVRRLNTMLINLEQVRTAVARSRPGDIIVERRNWYLSNVALPGFWPHAALWLGSAEEMAAFLDDDSEVKTAYGGAFTVALGKRFPEAWRAYSSNDEEGHVHRILEAISEGVVFTSAEHSIRCDYAAAMRPRLSRVEIARAIERAFSYYGRPYDFDFDFYTDTSLVCSELIYKAYEPRRGIRGLELPLERVAGRMTLGPNTMVRQFDVEHGSATQQLDFAWFLDGRERARNAEWVDLTVFRDSHRRFKWDIVQK